MRVAPLGQLATAPERSLFDDTEHGGFAWELGRGAIFARAGTAMLLAKTSTDEGLATYGFRIDAKGNVSPVTVAR
jgi:hypothetical protein